MSSSLPSTTGNAAAPLRGPISVNTREPAAPLAKIGLIDFLRIRLFLLEDTAPLPLENRIRYVPYLRLKCFSRVFGLFGACIHEERTFSLLSRKWSRNFSDFFEIGRNPRIGKTDQKRLFRYLVVPAGVIALDDSRAHFFPSG